MKKTIFLLAFAAMSLSLSAQSLTPELLQTLKDSYKNTPQDRAIRNAIGSTDLQTLAKNQDNMNALDHHFTYRVETNGITNQKKSGRCWLFCGLNVIRADVMRRFDIKELEFSENYLFFYDQLEKSNRFLERIIETRKLSEDDRTVQALFKSPIGDGGDFLSIADLVNKYGVIPSDVMHETFVAENTAKYKPLIQAKLREFAIAIRDSKGTDKQVRAMKEEQLKQVYRILSLCFGTPPTEFVWSQYGKKDTLISRETYTPKSFAAKYVRADITTNYIFFKNMPTRAYYKVYETEMENYTPEGHNWQYINLPVEEIQKMCIASLKDSVSLYTSSDVGKCRDSGRGLLDPDIYNYEDLMGVPFPMNKADRIRTFASNSTHAMALVAVDLDEDGKPVKWLLENSWGDKSGWKGFLQLTDAWFHEYIFGVAVEKKYVPQEIQDLLNTKHVMLPYWDPVGRTLDE